MLTSRHVPRAVRTAALTCQAWLWLFLFDVASRAGFARIHGRLRRCRTAPRLSAVTDDVLWAVDEACVWYFKRVACLQRSAITTWMLRRHGIPAQLVIGYRPLPFESHAWVELHGAVVNDRPQYQKAFTVLDRL